MTILSKCANPECGAAFDYRQGRLFRFLDERQRVAQHFWFCESCDEAYTLHPANGKGIAIRRRVHPVGARLMRLIDPNERQTLLRHRIPA